jgi:hypothetical protein
VAAVTLGRGNGSTPLSFSPPQNPHDRHGTEARHVATGLSPAEHFGARCSLQQGNGVPAFFVRVPPDVISFASLIIYSRLSIIRGGEFWRG